MKKLKFNSTLNHKQSDYTTHEIIVEKVVTLYGKSFSELKSHPMHDNPYIAENRDLMYIDNDDVAHCLLLANCDSGDGILVESEGSNYARKSQFIPNARALLEKNELTDSEWKIHENLKEIHKDIKAEISRRIGVEPIMINSALVSAQSRKRCYWTNIPSVIPPEDKGILLKDIIESGVAWQGKTYCLTANYSGAYLKNTLERHQRTMIAEPIGCAVRSRYVNSGGRNRKIEGGTFLAVEARKDGKANCMTTVSKDSMILQPLRIGDIGSKSQGHRVYSVHGKSVTVSAGGGGQGGTTGLYKIDLPDGDYIIRKLSPVECERLQTLPDNYTEGVSNTQRYKQLGNGWTVDVIAHILKNIK